MASRPYKRLSSMTPTGSRHMMNEALPAVVRCRPSVIKIWNTKNPKALMRAMAQRSVRVGRRQVPESHRAASAMMQATTMRARL